MMKKVILGSAIAFSLLAGPQVYALDQGDAAANRDWSLVTAQLCTLSGAGLVRNRIVRVPFSVYAAQLVLAIPQDGSLIRKEVGQAGLLMGWRAFKEKTRTACDILEVLGDSGSEYGMVLDCGGTNYVVEEGDGRIGGYLYEEGRYPWPIRTGKIVMECRGME